MPKIKTFEVYGYEKAALLEDRVNEFIATVASLHSINYCPFGTGMVAIIQYS